MDKTYDSTDDTIYGPNIRYVYCYSHCRVHSTGWCTCSCLDKIPLLSNSLKEAQIEWEMKAIVFGIKL